MGDSLATVSRLNIPLSSRNKVELQHLAISPESCLYWLTSCRTLLACFGSLTLAPSASWKVPEKFLEETSHSLYSCLAFFALVLEKDKSLLSFAILSIISQQSKWYVEVKIKLLPKGLRFSKIILTLTYRISYSLYTWNFTQLR